MWLYKSQKKYKIECLLKDIERHIGNDRLSVMEKENLVKATFAELSEYEQQCLCRVVNLKLNKKKRNKENINFFSWIFSLIVPLMSMMWTFYNRLNEIMMNFINAVSENVSPEEIRRVYSDIVYSTAEDVITIIRWGTMIIFVPTVFLWGYMFVLNNKIYKYEHILKLLKDE